MSNISMGALGIQMPTVGDIFFGTDYGQAMYNSNGEYIGGSQMMDIYCNLHAADDPRCHIPSEAEIRARALAELQTTSAPQEAIDRAMKLGDQAIAADCAARPDDCKAQCAASLHPSLSSVFGPGMVATFFPTDVNCNPSTPWLAIGLGIASVLAIAWIFKR